MGADKHEEAATNLTDTKHTGTYYTNVSEGLIKLLAGNYSGLCNLTELQHWGK